MTKLAFFVLWSACALTLPGQHGRWNTPFPIGRGRPLSMLHGNHRLAPDQLFSPFAGIIRLPQRMRGEFGRSWFAGLGNGTTTFVSGFSRTPITVQASGTIFGDRTDQAILDTGTELIGFSGPANRVARIALSGARVTADRSVAVADAGFSLAGFSPFDGSWTPHTATETIATRAARGSLAVLTGQTTSWIFAAKTKT